MAPTRCAAGLALTLVLGCAVALASEMAQQQGEQVMALKPTEQPKKDQPAHESSLQHGNTLQIPEDREEIKNAPKWSLAGEADPGYGQASASRTDMQRAHEADVAKRRKIKAKAAAEGEPVPAHDPLEPADSKEARHYERYIYRRINQKASVSSAYDRERARQQNNIAAIKTKAKLIQTKMKQAVKEIKQDMAKEKERADAEQEGNAEEEEMESDKKKTPEQIKRKRERQSIEAEMEKLRVADHEAAGSYDASRTEGGLFHKDEPIAVHKSRNWVDKTRRPDLSRYRPAGDAKNPASWREKGNTEEAQNKP